MVDTCILHLYQASLVHHLCGTYCGARLNCVNWHLLGVHEWKMCHTLGSHSSRFSGHSPGFMGFKAFCPCVPKNLVQNTWASQCHKNVTFWLCVWTCDFHIVEENICRNKTAINQPLTERKTIGRGRCVDYWL